MTDSTGAVVNSYQYDAYGNRSSSSETVANPFGYAGGYRDSESGLYYLQARYYDPSTQQFLTVDPLVAATGQAYTYVAGSPLNGTDPSGQGPEVLVLAPLCPECIPIALGVGAVVVGGWLIWNLVNELHHQQDQSQICSGTQTLPEQQIQTQVQSRGAQVYSRSRFSGDKRTAREIISQEKAGKIMRKFPGEWLDRTPDDIYRAAERGDGKARTAKKLLDSNEYDK